jgi:hypothetical protein
MKVFISHQRADSTLAGNVALRLRTYHQIDCYLDLIDPEASKTGDKLGEHLREQLGLCTQLLAVVSQNTKTSWWVPWEIGISTEKDQPIATYAGDNTTLPEYLRKWPYLRTHAELDEYARVSKAAEQTFAREKSFKIEARARQTSTQQFYRDLRARLGQ